MSPSPTAFGPIIDRPAGAAQGFILFKYGPYGECLNYIGPSGGGVIYDINIDSTK